MVRPFLNIGRMSVLEEEGASHGNSLTGVDLGKNICSLVGVDEEGVAVLRRRMRRQTSEPAMEDLQPKP
jgi:hypothetical protein